MKPSDDAWVDNQAEVLQFASVLVWADWLDTAPDVVYYFEKPQKYTNEYLLWIGCGRPLLDDKGWTWFIAKLEKLHG